MTTSLVIDQGVEIARVVVEWDLYYSSRNFLDGRHNKTISKWKKKAAYAAWVDWVVQGRRGADNLKKVSIRLIVRRPRPLDEANIIDAFKPVQDALFRRNTEGEGITPDDNQKWVTWGYPVVTQECGSEWKDKEQVEIIVCAVGEGPPPPRRRKAALPPAPPGR